MGLIRCPECRSEMSEKARVCPRCGAPNGVSAPLSAGGSTCPFSGHLLPAGETRCVCGAYYGYSNIAATAHLWQGIGLIAAAPLPLLCARWVQDEAEMAWCFGIAASSAIFGTLYLLSASVPMLRGKRWWQSF